MNKALRQAMAYAVDNNAIATKFYSGIRQAANTMITPNFVDYHNADQEGYDYDPEQAKQILADAGFVDNDGDGFVEDPDRSEERRVGKECMSWQGVGR